MGDRPRLAPEDNSKRFPDFKLRGTIDPEKNYNLALKQTLEILMGIIGTPKKISPQKLKDFGDALYDNYNAIPVMKKTAFLLQIESFLVSFLGYSGVRIAQQMREFINLGKNEVVLQIIGQHISSSIQISRIMDKKVQKGVFPKLQGGWYRVKQQTNEFVLSILEGKEIPYNWMEIPNLDMLKRDFEGYLYRKTEDEAYWKEIRNFLLGKGKVFLGTYNGNVVEWSVDDIEPETQDMLWKAMGVVRQDI